LTDSSRNDHLSEKLWLILWIGFFVRWILPLLAFIATKDRTVFHSPDTGPYVELARRLAAGRGFSAGGIPEIVRTPGFPVFLLPGILLGHLAAWTIALQVLLSTLTIYLVYKISLALFADHKAALLSALLYAMEPLSVLYSAKLLTETLFTALITFFLYMTIRYFGTGRRRYLAVSALAVAASAYVRPIAYYLPFMLTMILLIRALWVRAGIRRRLTDALLFSVISLGLIAAWQVRNGLETGYSGFSAIAEKNLYFYKAASVVAADEGRSYYAVQKSMGYMDDSTYARNHPEQAGWSRAEKLEYMGKEGLRIIVHRPLTYAGIHLKGMLRTILDPGATEYLRLFKRYPRSGGLLGTIIDRGVLATARDLARENPALFWSNVVLFPYLLAYLFFAAAGLAAPRPAGRDVRLVVLVLTALYLWILSGGANSLGRFRHPIMPVLCVLAGWGVSALLYRHAMKPAAFKRRK